ncbi:hypothetical protein ACIBQX_21015 [Nonomuraea sp. NPDC049714]|uniref:hypothetical protein n=1 Tax=Nonomuraea sp. NPDC049714 TaxID=3364357 RepID=UPI00379E59C4
MDVFDVLDVQVAAKEGYPRATIDEQQIAEFNAENSVKHAPSTEEMKAYDGLASEASNGAQIPKGGCSGEARMKVYGDSQLPADARMLASRSRGYAMTDSRIKEAIAKWRTCMAESGLQYDSPVVPAHDQRWEKRDAATAASEEERRVAAVDAKCRTQVNLLETYKTVRAGYEAQLLAQEKDNLESAKLEFARWVTNAKSIIAAG